LVRSIASQSRLRRLPELIDPTANLVGAQRVREVAAVAAGQARRTRNGRFDDD
jgi:hypothetical protein